MISIDPHIFRAYDIRGVAETQLTEEACMLIGKGFGSVLREMYNKEHPVVAVGRDARTHGSKLEKALVEGLISTGCAVIMIGETPSPVNYFTICDQNLDGSVQVTASHNPKEDNGLKLQTREAEAYAGDHLQELRERIDAQKFAAGEGSTKKIDAIKPYLHHLLKVFAKAGKRLNVVIDGGNGVAGPTYVKAIESVGYEVTGLYIDPDGTFPNHPADPSKYETLRELQEKVQAIGADIGFGFDGDGDRLGIVDEKGNILTADHILLLLAEDHLSRNPQMPVVFTVSNSGILETEISKWGGRPVMCKVGHSFVEHAMREEGAKLGGEQSGHFFCGEEYFDYDDALVAALRVLKIMSAKKSPLSSLIARYPKIYQSPERRPFCPDSEKSRIVAQITKHFKKDYPVNDLDGARIDFGDGAWAGIRQSNTSPKLSIVIEARSPQKLQEVESIVLTHVKMYPEVDLSQS